MEPANSIPPKPNEIGLPSFRPTRFWFVVLIVYAAHHAGFTIFFGLMKVPIPRRRSLETIRKPGNHHYSRQISAGFEVFGCLLCVGAKRVFFVGRMESVYCHGRIANPFLRKENHVLALHKDAMAAP